MTTQGGAKDFATLIKACESFGPYCPIGGLAVNCYVEPVYTLDVGPVIIASSLNGLASRLTMQGLRIEEYPSSLNAAVPESRLRIQFAKDERYQPFLTRSNDAEVLGVPVRVANLRDVAQGKLWAFHRSRKTIK